MNRVKKREFMRHSAEWIGKDANIIDGRGQICGRILRPLHLMTQEELMEEVNQIEEALNKC